MEMVAQIRPHCEVGADSALCITLVAKENSSGQC